MLPTAALLSIDYQKLPLLDGDLFDVGKGCIVTAVRALRAARKLANWSVRLLPPVQVNVGSILSGCQ